MGVAGLHKVVVFKQNTPGALGAGTSNSYSTLLTTRGKLTKLSGGRSLSYGELIENNSYDLIVRFQTALYSALRMDMKVEIDSRTFTIASWELMDEKRFYIRLIVNEQRN